MANFTQIKLAYGLTATAALTKSQSRGPGFIGASGSLTFAETENAIKTYVITATLASTGDTLSIDPVTGIATAGTAPVSQVETATAAGTIGTSGNASVVFTAARVTGSPITLSVPVLSGDTASAWATKVRNALTANAAIAAVYTIGGSGTSITATETDPQNNDTTLNIALANGTCTGITAAPTSANTTAGVGGVKLTANTGDGKDMEGISLGTMDLVYAVMIRNTGTAGVNGAIQIDLDGKVTAPIEPGGLIGYGDPIGAAGLFTGTWTVESSAGACLVEITVSQRQIAA